MPEPHGTTGCLPSTASFSVGRATSSASDPSKIDRSLDSRAGTFESPSGAPGEKVVLADLEGPGTIRHGWMTFPPARPEWMRALWLGVFQDGATKPSVSVPCLDFFGLSHGRPAHYMSALTAAQQGKGFNAYFPIPFRRRIRIELTNSSARPMHVYYPLDYTLEWKLSPDTGLLHVSFRRENPTRLHEDFTLATDPRGPGRYLGCSVGIRVLPAEHFVRYGEGEPKIYRDCDTWLPRICGTGLEDYVCTARGTGQHFALYGGVPLEVCARDMLQNVAQEDGQPAPIIGPAAKLSRTPLKVRSGAPEFGAHSDEILAEIGIDADARAKLRADRII